ncbi:uncharacterized protein [Typha angustifolia]|uniref:uncharacterized protein n=1 Tax=Typha angustifolia TaxID=59011 RepID=UPI003C30231B
MKQQLFRLAMKGHWEVVMQFFTEESRKQLSELAQQDKWEEVTQLFTKEMKQQMSRLAKQSKWKEAIHLFTEETKQQLFKLAMQGKWEKVIEQFKEETRKQLCNLVEQGKWEDVTKLFTEETKHQLSNSAEQGNWKEVIQLFTQETKQLLFRLVMQDKCEEVIQLFTKKMSEQLSRLAKQCKWEKVNEHFTKEMKQELSTLAAQGNWENVIEVFIEKMKQQLFRLAMQGKWERVIQLFTQKIGQQLSRLVEQNKWEEVVELFTQEMNRQLFILVILGKWEELALLFPDEIMKQQLFKLAMEGKWEDVIKLVMAETSYQLSKLNNSAWEEIMTQLFTVEMWHQLPKLVMQDKLEKITQLFMEEMWQQLFILAEQGEWNEVIQLFTEEMKLFILAIQGKWKEVTKLFKNEMRKQLFILAMQSKWKEVIQLYEGYPEVQGEMLTHAKDTTLHVAISAGNESTVLALLAAMGDRDVKSILDMRNDSGSTPLHLAAALDMHLACGEMARLVPNLVMTARNKNGETPLFTAVRHGKKKAFFALEWSVQDQSRPTNMKKRDLTHCRRDKDGNNILHFAILGEYFDLANEIINLYPELVNYVNAEGLSALHFLANKPLCFRSGTRFGLYDRVIYSCITIAPLKSEFTDYKNHKSDKPQIIKFTPDDPILPETFDTCSHTFTLLKEPFNDIGIIIESLKRKFVSISKLIRGRHAKDDVEDPAAEAPTNNLTSTPGDDDQESSKENEETEVFRYRKFPEIYDVGVDLFKLVMKFLLVVMGIGLWRTQALERKKRKNKYACQLMDKLVECCKEWEYEKERGGMNPEFPRSISDSPPELDPNSVPNVDSSSKTESSDGKSNREDDHPGIDKDEQKQKEKGEAPKEPNKATPLLVAAKNGITEMVEKILETFTVAVLDVDENEKNIVLLAVEHRQSHIYELMLKRKTMKDSVFGKVDMKGNSALHLAANLSEKLPWSIPGEALQMQWEIKWYKYVMQSMDLEFFATYNNEGKTAQELFTESHKDLVKEAGKWLLKTSESCSVVAALIAGVAFASAATVPGGLDQNSGDPILSGHIPFQVFAFSALVALCFSVTSLIMFLTILTSRYQEQDFDRSLPTKLIFGLTSLFTSIAAMLVSFCAGDFFIVEKKLKYAAFAIYGVMCLPVSFFAIAQFPLYVDLITATIAILPERTQKMQTF